MARKKKIRLRPQPPIDRWAHPTGQRPRWLVLVLIGAGLTLGGWAAARVHDVFGDGDLHMSEWALMRSVTVGGPRRPAPPPEPAPPPSELDLAVQQFLGNDDAPAQDPAQRQPKASEQTQDDFCPT